MLLLMLVLVAGVAEAAIGDVFQSVKKNGVSFVKPVVNTLLISGLVYFALMVFKVIDGISGTNRWIVFGILFLVVLLLILSPVISAPKGSKMSNLHGLKWAWQYDVLEEFKYFLWGTRDGVQDTDSDGRPMGILKNPTRLGIFAGSFIVFLWLFDFLKVGGEGGQAKLKYAFALIIAYSMVNQLDIGIDKVIIAGQLVGVFVIQKQIKDAVGNNATASFSLSALLMIVIGYIAFPNYDNLLNNVISRGMLALIVGTLLFFVGFGVMTKVAGGTGKFGGGGLVLLVISFILTRFEFSKGFIYGNPITMTVGFIVISATITYSVVQKIRTGNFA